MPWPRAGLARSYGTASAGATLADQTIITAVELRATERGLPLTRSYFDSVNFNEKGNEVVLARQTNVSD